MNWIGRKVLVTGGAGFIGSHLADKLIELGAQVRIVDNLERGTRANINPLAEFLELDLRKPGNCDIACQNMNTVFHLAAKVGGIKYYMESPEEILSMNILIDSNMLVASKYAAENYLYASSSHVYPGDMQCTPDAPALREQNAFPADPVLSYGWEKLMAEKLLEYAKVGPMKIAIARLCGIYGPRQDTALSSSVIPVFSRRTLEYPETPFYMWGTGEETRSYCFISDAVKGMIRAVEETEQRGWLGAINIGREGRIRIIDLAHKIINLSGKEITISMVQAQLSPIVGQAVNCEKARLLLNWEAEVSLDSGLQITYDYIKRSI